MTIDKPPPIAALSPVERITWQLGVVLSDLDRYRNEERSGTAVTQLHRTVRDLGADLDAAKAAEAAGQHERVELSDAELVDAIREVVAGLPDALVDEVAAMVAARRRGALVAM